MIEAIEKVKDNGGFDEEELAAFREQIRMKQDRDQRLEAAQVAFGEMQKRFQELRCTLNPLMICTQQGNTFQFQIVVN